MPGPGGLAVARVIGMNRGGQAATCARGLGLELSSPCAMNVSTRAFNETPSALARAAR